jgi:hypothetical protein
MVTPPYPMETGTTYSMDLISMDLTSMDLTSAWM